MKTRPGIVKWKDRLFAMRSKPVGWSCRFTGRILFPGVIFFASLHVAGQQANESGSSLPAMKRYEEMLLRSPGAGTAFDQIYRHYLSNAGLDALEQRWMTQLDNQSDKSYALNMLLGLLAERRGRIGQAEAFYTSARDWAPQNHAPWAALGNLAISSGNLDKGIEYLLGAIDRPIPYGEIQEIYLQLARAQNRNFDAEGAAQTFRKLANAFPDDPQVLLEVGDALLEAQLYDEATATYAQVEALAGAGTYNGVAALMKRAQVEERRGNYQKALDLYIGGLDRTHPSNWLYRELSSRIENIFRRRGDVFGLVEYYRKRNREGSRDLDAALRLGTVLLETNQVDEALEWLTKASQWAPEREDIRYQIALLLSDEERFDEAVPMLKQLVSGNPGSWEYRETLGEVYWRQFQAQGGREHEARALETWRGLENSGGRDMASLNRLGDLMRMHGRVHEALAYYHKALKLSPESFDMRERIALYLFSLDRNEEAWEVLDESDNFEKTANNYLRLAQFQKRYKRYAEARESVEKGLAIKPGDFNLLEFKWRLLAETEAWDEALQLYPEVAAAAPNVYFFEEVEGRYVRLLRSHGSVNEVRNELASRFQNGDPLTEDEIRLLMRMELEGYQADRLEELVAAARERFPESDTLARLEAEYARRYGSLHDQVANWRRLMRLHPRRKAEWLRQITLAYRNNAMWEEARATARELIGAYPADPQAHLLYAEVCYAADWNEAGNEAILQAMRLAANPHDLSMRLARALTEQGSYRKAAEMYRKTFEASEDYHARKALIRPMVELYLIESNLDGLIDFLKEKQAVSFNQWEYHLHLAEVYQDAEDLSKARVELSRALAYRRNDPKILKQLISLSEADENSEEHVRYARMLSRQEPSAENELELAQALLEAGEGEEALSLITRNIHILLQDPYSWKELQPDLEALGLGEEFSQILLNAFSRQETDWRSMLALAEYLIAMGNEGQAETLLWKIMDIPEEMLPVSMIQPMPAASGGEATSRIWQHYQLGQYVRSAFQDLLASRFKVDGRLYGTVGGGRLRTLADGQIAALIHLSGLAAAQDRTEAFIRELDSMLDRLSSGREGRVMTYLQARALDRFFDEIQYMLDDSGYNPDLAVFCYNVLINLVYSTNFPQLDKERLEVLSQRLEAEIVEHEPERNGKIILSKVHRLNSMGYREEALKLLDRHWEELEDSSAVQMSAARLYLSNGNLERFLEVMPRVLDRFKANPEERGYSLARSLLTEYFKAIATRETLDSASLELLDRLLEITYREPAGNPGALSSASFSNLQQKINRYLKFPFPSDYHSQQDIQTYRQLFNILKNSEHGDEVIAHLESVQATIAAPRRTDAALTSVYFLWWSGRKNEAVEAISALAQKTNNDELYLMAGDVLSHSGQKAEALEWYKNIQSDQGALAIIKLVRIINGGRLAGERETARQAALKLAASNPPAIPNFDLNAVLKEFGLEDEFSAPSLQTAGAPTRSRNWNQMRDLLVQHVRQGNHDEAEKLAVYILRRTPLATKNSQQSWIRNEALKQLQSIRRLDRYISNLEKQLVSTPDSVRITHLLAEVYSTYENGTHRKETTTITAKDFQPLPVSLKLMREGDQIHAYYKNEGISEWQLVGSVPFPAKSNVLAGIAVSNGQAGRTARAMFSNITEENAVVGDEIAKSWTSADIGRTRNPGETRCEGETITIEHPGGGSDSLRFAGKKLTGDSVLTAVLAGFDQPDPRSRAGLMVRDSLQPEAAYVMLGATAKGRISFQYNDVKESESLRYFRRLTELRPSNRFYLDLLIRKLAQERRYHELADIYLRSLQDDFLSTLQQKHDLAETFINSNRVDELVERILAAEYAPPALSRVQGIGSAMAGSMQRIGISLQKNGYREPAVTVWEKAISVVPPERSVELRRLVLMETRPHQDAAKTAKLLSGYMLSNENEDALASWMRPHLDNRLPAWMTSGQIINNRHFLPVLELIDMVENPEVWPMLEEAAREQLMPEAGTAALSAHATLLLIHLEMQEPGAPAEALRFLEAIDEATGPFRDYYRSSIYLNILPVVAERLSADYDTGRLSMQLLDLAIGASDGNPNDYQKRTATRYQKLDLALSLDDLKSARETTLQLMGIIEEHDTGHAGSFDFAQGFKVIEKMLDLEMLEEANELVSQANRSLQAKSNANYRRKILGYERQLRLFQGMVERPMATVWLEPLTEADGTAKIIWEIGEAVEPTPFPNRQDIDVFGRAFHGLDGRYDLEIIMTGNDGHAETLMLLENATAQGMREAPVPPGYGALQAVLHQHEEGVSGVTGKTTPFLNAPNLISNPGFDPGQEEFGWDLPEGTPGSRQGGLDSDERYVEFAGTARRDAMIMGEKIPLEAGNDYFQSVWLRFDEDSVCRLGRRYLDKEGNEISITYSQAEQKPLGWSYVYQVLLGSEEYYENFDLIPSEAAYVQPILLVRNTVSWDSLYLGKIPAEEKPEILARTAR